MHFTSLLCCSCHTTYMYFVMCSSSLILHLFNTVFFILKNEIKRINLLHTYTRARSFADLSCLIIHMKSSFPKGG